MKLKLALALLLLAAAPATHAATPMAASLRVTVDGSTPAGGTLRVGLYDEPTFPLAGGTALRSQDVANRPPQRP